MKHPSSQQFFAYWDEVRGPDKAPARAAFEPGPVRHLLGDSFVLAYGQIGGFPFRVAGTRLCALLGCDVKGQDFNALWQRDSGFRLIDRAGQVIDQADAAAFRQLLVLVGDHAPAHVGELLAMLAREPDLAARVRGAVWVGDRRWNLRFDNGVDVKLPADSPQTAWSQLAKLEREQHLLARDVTVIDMRLPDRLTVRLGSGAEVQQGDQTHQPGSNT